MAAFEVGLRSSNVYKSHHNWNERLGFLCCSFVILSASAFDGLQGAYNALISLHTLHIIPLKAGLGLFSGGPVLRHPVQAPKTQISKLSIMLHAGGHVVTGQICRLGLRSKTLFRRLGRMHCFLSYAGILPKGSGAHIGLRD